MEQRTHRSHKVEIFTAPINAKSRERARSCVSVYRDAASSCGI